MQVATVTKHSLNAEKYFAAIKMLIWTHEKELKDQRRNQTHRYRKIIENSWIIVHSINFLHILAKPSKMLHQSLQTMSCKNTSKSKCFIFPKLFLEFPVIVLLMFHFKVAEVRSWCVSGSKSDLLIVWLSRCDATFRRQNSGKCDRYLQWQLRIGLLLKVLVKGLCVSDDKF